MTARVHGVILPVVLLVLVLLGLLIAMFSFRVNADLATTQAVGMRLQTRLAAEAGVDRIKQILRESRFDIDRWYHNPDELHRVIVWMNGVDGTVWGTNDEFDEPTMAYRFSIVADDPTDDEDLIRIGITDESSKLNLNTATSPQLLSLVRAAVGQNQEINPQDIVDAILDWRDRDRTPRGKAGDTEGVYYRRLPKPYRVKNGDFATVEELLLVKGVTGQILYGEDFDRNGLLTPNEEDGDLSFPPDNEDSVLNRGLYPYLTVLSSEDNVSNENRQRIYLGGDESTLRAGLETVFPGEPNVVNFIVRAALPGTQGSGGGAGNNAGANTGGEGGDEQGEGNEPLGSTGNTEGAAGGGSEERGGDEGAAVAAGGANRRSGRANGAAGRPVSILTPAALLRNPQGSGSSPVTLEHLATLLDRTTTVRDRKIRGLVNINTAPPRVLRALGGFTQEVIELIMEQRDRLSPEDKETPAWLLTEEIVDQATFERLAPMLTARGQQFTIESLGYADHIGMVTRLHVVVDMLGPVTQTIYYRDVTYLGGHFPIREEDLELLRAR